MHWLRSRIEILALSCGHLDSDDALKAANDQISTLRASVYVVREKPGSHRFHQDRCSLGEH
jgi:hypothetical protein